MKQNEPIPAFFPQVAGRKYFFDEESGYIREEYSKHYPARPMYDVNRVKQHKIDKEYDEKMIRIIHDLMGLTLQTIFGEQNLSFLNSSKERYERNFPGMNKYFKDLKRRGDIEVMEFRRYLFETNYCQLVHQLGVRHRNLGNSTVTVKCYKKVISICEKRKSYKVIERIEDKSLKNILYQFRKSLKEYICILAIVHNDLGTCNYLRNQVKQAVSNCDAGLKYALEYQDYKRKRKEVESEMDAEFCCVSLANQIVGNVLSSYMDISLKLNKHFDFFYYLILSISNFTIDLDLVSFSGRPSLVLLRTGNMFVERERFNIALKIYEKLYEFKTGGKEDKMYSQRCLEIAQSVCNILSYKVNEKEKIKIWGDRLVKISKKISFKYYGEKSSETMAVMISKNLLASSLCYQGKVKDAKKIWKNCLEWVKTLPPNKRKMSVLKEHISSFQKKVQSDKYLRSYISDLKNSVEVKREKMKLYNLEDMKNDQLDRLKKIFKRKTKKEVIERIKEVFTGEAVLHACKNLKNSEVCWNCRLPFDKLKKCAACTMALYCSRTCQRMNWKSHKEECL